jgi:hypothetical protein
VKVAKQLIPAREPAGFRPAVEDDQRAVADGLAQPRFGREVELPQGEPLRRPSGRGPGDQRPLVGEELGDVDMVDAQGTRGDPADVAKNAGAVPAAQGTSGQIEERPVVTRTRVRFRLLTVVGIAKDATDGERPPPSGEEPLHLLECLWGGGRTATAAQSNDPAGLARKIVSKL